MRARAIAIALSLVVFAAFLFVMAERVDAAVTAPTCAQIETYQEQIFELATENDEAMEALELMSEVSSDDLTSLTRSEYRTLGDGFTSLAEDMEDLRVHRSMQDYHEAMTDSMMTLGLLFTEAADSGFFASAMLYADQVERVGENTEDAEKVLTRGCPSWQDD